MRQQCRFKDKGGKKRNDFTVKQKEGADVTRAVS